MWLYTFYIVFTHIFGAPEVITLIRDRNVTCITTGDSRYSPIYIAWTNMTQKFNSTRTVNEFKKWINDDWDNINTNNTQFSFEPVIDIRWEQFKDGIAGIKRNPGITIFSVCSLESNPINFHIPKSNGNCNNNFTFNKTQICELYIFNVTQSKCTIRPQGQMAHEINCPTNVSDFIKPNASNALLRTHKYGFKYSNVATNDTTGSSVSVESSDSSCISMFISIDKGCYLNVTISNKNETSVQRYEGFNDENALKRWKRIEIKSKYKVGNVSFIRGREDGTNEGFWAIDFIHSCRPNPDYVTFDVPAHVDVLSNFTCKVLNDTSSTNAYNKSCENPENIGKDCVDCPKVLGQSKLQCDYQKICVENNCHCGVGYQGPFCNQKRFPILTRAPILKSITNISLTICSDMEYGTADEVSPEHYQIQYRKDNDKTFTNFSTPKPYAKSVETNISEVTPNQNSYEIRIILIIQNEATEEDAPKLTTYKKSLTANFVDSDNIMLTWNSSNNTDKEYFLTYTCHLKFCSFENTTVGNFTTNETKAELKVENFNYCNVNLYLKKPSDVNLLLDQIQITAPTINETELPKNIILSDNKIILEFETCDRFRGPLNYNLEFRCLNESCLKENFTIKDIPFYSYTNKTELSYNFQPSINYNITVTAFRSTIYLKRYFIKQTPSGNISVVHENYIYILLGVTAILMFISLTTAFICCKCIRFKTTQREREPPENLELIPAIFEPNNRKTSTITECCLRPIKVDEFETYLQTTFKEDSEDNEIVQQYKILSKKKSKEITHGRSPKNIHKNRYKTLVPYDETRVTLTKNDDENDYINANYVDGYKTPRAFIATQAPLESTVSDFWVMVCQENVSTIVMLCNLRENGHLKSEQYWPDENSKCRFGKFLIENVATKNLENYIHRTLLVKYDNKMQWVHHFQYVTWPDHGTPSSVQAFNSFLKEIMDIPQYNCPTIVHCVAGCGRTGTFILCHIIIQMAKEENQMDFPKILDRIREQRPAMVSNCDQYIFAHFAVAEHFFGKDFSIPVDENFYFEIQKLMNNTSLGQLMVYLDKVSSQHQKSKCKMSYQLTDEEKSKNRFHQILPGYSQVYLPTTSESPSNYINAVIVDCYHSPKKFIVTQQPLPNTIEDFWKLVNSHKIELIVSLNEIIDNDSNCPRFWPDRGQQIWPVGNDMILTFIDEEIETAFNTITVKIGDKKSKSQCTVIIITLKNWHRTTQRPINGIDLIRVYKRVFKLSNQILVTCYDGATASGLFVALAFLLEKMNLNRSCDVFDAVKTVRESRPEFVRTPEQLEFLCQAAMQYFQELNTEEN